MTKLLARMWEHLHHRVLLADKPLSDPEPVYGEGRAMTGLFAHLTPEQKRRALAHRGEDNHGSDEFRRPAA